MDTFPSSNPISLTQTREKCPHSGFSSFLAFGLNRRDSVRMRENKDQKNSECGPFSHSEISIQVIIW